MKKAVSGLLVLTVLLLAGCAPAVQGPSMQPTQTPQPVPGAAQVPGTAPADTPEPVRQVLPEDVSATVNGITVKVDPLMEMLSIVQYLSSYDRQFGLMTEVKTPYHDDIDAAFSPYKDHFAVQYINITMKNGFSYDSPPTACLYIDKDFTILEDYADSDYAHTRMTADMELFRDAMEQFYADTDFGSFFAAHQDFYTRMIEGYAQEFPEWDMAAAMEQYYGKTMSAYTIVLVPLFHAGGYGPSLDRPDGTHIYSIQGPYWEEEGVPAYGDREAISRLVLHEFGHSFIPIGDVDNEIMSGEVVRSAYLFGPISYDMSQMAYPSWTIAYEELVLRAAVIDLMVRETGADPEPLLAIERNRRFIYIDDVYEVIKDYTANRDLYPQFDSFIPIITDDLLEKHPQ